MLKKDHMNMLLFDQKVEKVLFAIKFENYFKITNTINFNFI